MAIKKIDNPYADEPVQAALWEQGYLAGYEQGQEDFRRVMLAGIKDLDKTLPRLHKSERWG